MQVTSVQASNLSDLWFKLLGEAIDKGRIYEVSDRPHIGRKRLELEFALLHVRCPWEKLWPDKIRQLFSSQYFEAYMDWLLSRGGVAFNGSMPTKDYTKLIEPIPALAFACDTEFDLSPLGLLIYKYRMYGTRTNRACIELSDLSDIARKFPACIRLIDTRVQDNKLHFFCYFRSWDLWNKFSFDLAVLERVKQYVAEQIRADNGELIASSKGIHLYEEDWKKAEQAVGREIKFKGVKPK